jgi:beta-glucosidase
VWGAGTSAYQVEGAAYEDGRGESIWDRFSHTPGRTANGDTGDVACDHYHRWRDDIALMRALGVGAYRFSVAWPRILPQGRGRPNDAGLDFYDQLVDGLLEAGITPWVTLYHWDLPQPLEDEGGWPSRATAEVFAAFADAVTARLGDRVSHWITLNEPWSSAFLGYRVGHHAPGRTSTKDALRAAHALLLAHGMAVPIVRANSTGARVGIALNLGQIYPATASPEDEAAAERFDGSYNRWFLDPLYGRGYPPEVAEMYGADAPRTLPADLETIAAPTDFLGLNYYNPTFVRHAPDAPPAFVRAVRREGEYTETNWLVYPQGLYDLMTRVAAEYPTGPLYVTANGAAYVDEPPRHGRMADPERTAYHAGHLAACARAIRDGVPLRGYFAWSLLDSFEWAMGYTRRFGITYVDYATQQRTLKDSGRWYARVVARNGMPSGE